MNKRVAANWKFKALIGACGGVCLMIIRLIQSEFFIYEDGLNQLSGYLGALGLVMLSTIFTCFVDESSPGKLFMQALLAPSLLVAIVAAGAVKYQGEILNKAPIQELQSEPKITAQISRQVPGAGIDYSMLATFLAPTEVRAPAMIAFGREQSRNDDPGIEIISKMDIVNLKDGVLTILGRPQPPKRFIFVIAKTTDETLAKNSGVKLKKFFHNIGVKVHLYRPEGANEIYVTAGEFNTLEATREIERNVKENASWIPDYDTRELLKNGRVVDGRTLFM